MNFLTLYRLTFLFSITFYPAVGQQNDLLKYVDPTIGTAHCRWFFFTPAAVPFGMAKLAPSTNGSYGNKEGWEAVGYDCRHTSIEGFACLHEFQIGGFLFTGITGKLQTVPGKPEAGEKGYRSNFDKKDEYASPGYYRVKLKDYNVSAELTATARVGFQRYTFPKTDSAYIILDVGNKLGESGEVKEAFAHYAGDGIIEGWVITYPEYVKRYQSGGEVKMFFYGTVNKLPAGFGCFRGSEQYAGKSEIKGAGAGVYLRFKTSDSEPIELKTGFSYTSINNARDNFISESHNLNFDRAKKKAESAWNTELSKIKVSGKSEKDKVKFYTGLYHALLGRGLANDVNGAFPQNDGTVGVIPKDKSGKLRFQFYNSDALWGANWNLAQLWALLWPAYYNDLIQTNLQVFRNSGWLGDGIACSKFVSGVGTNFTGQIISSAYQTGVRDFDVELAYQAALKNETEFANRKEGAGKMDLNQFIKNGYVSYVPGMNTTSEGSGFSASHTLEYCYNTYAVAQMAKALGKEEDYRRLISLSKSWEKLFDPELRMIRPRLLSGKFIEPFDPLTPWIGFQEGNATQYTFYVPHDVKRLIELTGDKIFVNRLDSIFKVSEKTKFGGADINAFAGVSYPYNHGNQPNLHISWLFNFTSHPWLTQKWVRKICDEFYGTEEIHGYGFGQDEDQGQLGAWFVMAAIGLFDVGGLVDQDPSFQLGSPIFDSIELGLPNKKKVLIQASENTATNFYIQKLKVNGKEYNSNNIKLSLLKKSPDIRLYMGSLPNKNIFNR